MISAALSVFLLREQPWPAFEFPRGQTAAALTLMGLLTGLSLAGLPGESGEPLFSLAGAVLLGLVFNALLYALVHGILRRWLMRDGRWDGQGPLFNLLVAAGLMPNILSALFESLELPPDVAQLLGVVLALWGLWTVSRAVSWVIPKADMRFTMTGVALSSVFSLSVLALLTMGGLMAFGPDSLQEGNTAHTGAPGQAAGAGAAASNTGNADTGNASNAAPGHGPSAQTRASTSADCTPQPTYRDRPRGELARHHPRFDRHGRPEGAASDPCAPATASRPPASGSADSAR